MYTSTGVAKWRTRSSEEADEGEEERSRTVAYPPDKTITYSYDDVGNRSVLVDPDGDRTTYSYNGLDLLEWLVNRHDERTTVTYDALGRTTKITHGNLAYAETDYDDASRVEAVRNFRQDLIVLSAFTYTYDDADNATSVVEHDGVRVTWSYDNVYQLTR